MNTYSKFYPNVFLAKCEQQHSKGDVITLTTKYGSENLHVVHNLIYEKEGYFYYSITRLDGFDSAERARRKAEKYEGWKDAADTRGDDWRERSNEGAEFLRLAEPIKIGHHSEGRHRALIERNWNRMDNAMKEYKKAEGHEHKQKYWERKAQEINLSMPESVEYFEKKLKEEQAVYEYLRDNKDKRPHSYALTYARKNVRELEQKLEIARKLWL